MVYAARSSADAGNEISDAEQLQMDLQTGSNNVSTDGSASDEGESRVRNSALETIHWHTQ